VQGFRNSPGPPQNTLFSPSMAVLTVPPNTFHHPWTNTGFPLFHLDACPHSDMNPAQFPNPDVVPNIPHLQGFFFSTRHHSPLPPPPYSPFPPIFFHHRIALSRVTLPDYSIPKLPFMPPGCIEHGTKPPQCPLPACNSPAPVTIPEVNLLRVGLSYTPFLKTFPSGSFTGY